VIGVSVATEALAAASSTVFSYSVILPGPLATLMMPGRMPVSPMPSSISLMNSSDIASTNGPKLPRKSQ
jgi:hypothetical protein